MIIKKLCVGMLLAALWSWATAVQAATDVSVSSPGGTNKITVTSTDDHKLYYSVERGGQTIVSRSLLGFRTSGTDYSQNLYYKEHATVAINGTYSLPTGKASTYHDRCNELVVTATCGGNDVQYIFRAYDDGVAFCYSLGGSDLTVTSDLSEVRVAGFEKSWAMSFIKTYEGFYTGRSWSDMQGVADRRFCAPMLVKTSMGDNAWAMVTTSGADGSFCMMRLIAGNASDEGLLTYEMPSSATCTAGKRMPWHTIYTGTLAGMVASTLNENLNAPSRIGDTSWIKAGLSSWDWGGNDGEALSSSDDMPIIKKYIDMAAEMQWPYYTLDGGWGAHSGDAGEIARYALSKGVKPWLWFDQKEFGTTEAEIVSKLKTYADMGYVGIKVDFWEDDSQACLQKVENLLSAAASLKLMVNLHGFTMIGGQRRTWPNLIASEGVYGDEQTLFNETGTASTDCPVPTAAHNVNLVFTRNVMGPMDYTPVEFALKNGRVPHYTTWSHQLALATLFESGVQSICESYNNLLPTIASCMLKAMPASWDETRLLEGQPDSYATVMRRSGDDYYVASVSAQERTASVSLSFLPHNATYTAYIYKDGKCISDIAYDEQTVTQKTTLSIPVKAEGGFSVRISRKTSVSAKDRYKTYELEDAALTGIAEKRTDANGYCSGGYIGNMGNGATATLTGVEAPADGTYNLTLFYISADDRRLAVTANGTRQVFTLAGSSLKWPDGNLDYSSNSLMMATVQVELKKGANTLVLADDGGYAPDLDRIIVSPSESAALHVPDGKYLIKHVSSVGDDANLYLGTLSSATGKVQTASSASAPTVEVKAVEGEAGWYTLSLAGTDTYYALAGDAGSYHLAATTIAEGAEVPQAAMFAIESDGHGAYHIKSRLASNNGSYWGVDNEAEPWDVWPDKSATNAKASWLLLDPRRDAPRMSVAEGVYLIKNSTSTGEGLDATLFAGKIKPTGVDGHEATARNAAAYELRKAGTGAALAGWYTLRLPGLFNKNGNTYLTLHDDETTEEGRTRYTLGSSAIDDDNVASHDEALFGFVPSGLGDGQVRIVCKKPSDNGSYWGIDLTDTYIWPDKDTDTDYEGRDLWQLVSLNATPVADLGKPWFMTLDNNGTEMHYGCAGTARAQDHLFDHYDKANMVRLEKRDCGAHAMQATFDGSYLAQCSNLEPENPWNLKHQTTVDDSNALFYFLPYDADGKQWLVLNNTHLNYAEESADGLKYKRFVGVGSFDETYPSIFVDKAEADARTLWSFREGTPIDVAALPATYADGHAMLKNKASGTLLVKDNGDGKPCTLSAEGQPVYVTNEGGYVVLRTAAGRYLTLGDDYYYELFSTADKALATRFAMKYDDALGGYTLQLRNTGKYVGVDHTAEGSVVFADKEAEKLGEDATLKAQAVWLVEAVNTVDVAPGKYLVTLAANGKHIGASTADCDFLYSEAEGMQVVEVSKNADGTYSMQSCSRGTADEGHWLATVAKPNTDNWLLKRKADKDDASRFVFDSDGEGGGTVIRSASTGRLLGADLGTSWEGSIWADKTTHDAGSLWQLDPVHAVAEASDGNTAAIGALADKTGRYVSVDRTLKADGWYTLCLPFALTESDIAGQFRGAVFNEFSGTTVSDGHATVRFSAVRSTEAGKPYLVKPAETVQNLVFAGKTLVEAPVDVAHTDGTQTVTLRGIFDATPYDALQQKEEVSLVRFFGGSDGTTLKRPTSGTLKGMRAYLLLPEGSSLASVNVMFGGEATGIAGVEADGTDAAAPVYNIMGQRVADSTKGLPRGIYIVNGKKITVK